MVVGLRGRAIGIQSRVISPQFADRAEGIVDASGIDAPQVGASGVGQQLLLCPC